MPNGIRTENSLVIFRYLKVSWVKAHEMSCLLIFTSIYPLTRLIGLAVEMYRMKRLLNFLEMRTNQVDKSKNIPADKVNVPYQ